MFQNSPTCSKVIWGNEQKKICAMQLPRAKAQLWKEISAKFPNLVSNYNQFWSNNFNTKINQQSWIEIFVTFTPQIFPDNTSPDEVKRPLSKISLLRPLLPFTKKKSPFLREIIFASLFSLQNIAKGTTDPRH